MSDPVEPSVVPPAIDARNRPEQTPTAIIQKYAGFSGPLPPPALLAAYENGCEGAANRIILMAEKALDHQHSMEQQIVTAQLAESLADRLEAKRGQICALAVVLAALLGAVWTASTGHEITAGFIGTTGITGVVVAFLADKRRVEMQQTDESPTPNQQPPNSPAKRKRKR